MEKNKTEIIPKHVIELAETMKKLIKDDVRVVVCRSRQHSMTAAMRLLQTEDAEIIEQKKLNHG